MIIHSINKQFVKKYNQKLVGRNSAVLLLILYFLVEEYYEDILLISIIFGVSIIIFILSFYFQDVPLKAMPHSLEIKDGLFLVKEISESNKEIYIKNQADIKDIKRLSFYVNCFIPGGNEGGLDKNFYGEVYIEVQMKDSSFYFQIADGIMKPNDINKFKFYRYYNMEELPKFIEEL